MNNLTNIGILELSRDEMKCINGGGFFKDVGRWLYDAKCAASDFFSGKGQPDPALEAGYNCIILNK